VQSLAAVHRKDLVNGARCRAVCRKTAFGHALASTMKPCASTISPSSGRFSNRRLYLRTPPVAAVRP
jgi:hypothetical protein